MCRKLQIIIFLGVVFAATILLSACGSKEPQRGIDGYLYTSIELPLKDVQLVKFRGGYLYYTNITGSLYRIQEENVLSAFSGNAVLKGELVAAANSSEGSRIVDFALDNAGAVYYYLAETGSVKNPETGIWETKMGRQKLIKRSADGKEIYCIPLDLELDTWWGVSLAVDDGGWAFLLAKDTVYVFDPEGNPAGELDMGEYHSVGINASEQLAEGVNGRVYYVWTDGVQDLAVYEILKGNAGSGTDFRLERLTAFNEKIRVGSGYGTLFGSSGGLLYNDRDGILKRYRPEDGSFQELLRWSESGLTSAPDDIAWISEECLVAHFSTFEDGRQLKLYLLKRKDVEEVPEKEELIFAIVYPKSDLERRVAEFNQDNERYHITLKVYAGEEQQARLDAEMVSSYPPDLLDLSNMDAGKYAEKGLLEDLAPYLEGGDILDVEEYWDGIREGYTVGGRLVCLPRDFKISVFTGRESMVGGLESWDMNAVIALSEEHPGVRLTGRDNFQYALDKLCSDYILERYVDWESGTCTFDQGEFGELMLWLEEHTGGRYWGDAEGDYDRGIVPENILLVEEFWYSWSNLLYSEVIHQGDMCVRGYPTQNGQALYKGCPDTLIGIASGSRHKEGAWEFLEYYLSCSDTGYNLGFPAQKKHFAQKLEEQMTPEYFEDEDGSESTMRAKSSTVMDGEEIYYYYLTPEQAELLQYVVEHTAFSLNGGIKSEIMNIIMEEMDGYFKGEKTLEETTTVIQNRIQILVQERM